MAKPLVTNSNLKGFRGHPFADEALSAAGAQLRDLLRWHVAPVIEETVMVRSRGSNVLVLPTLRVVEVTKVQDAVTGQVITGWIDWQDGTLEFKGRLPKAVKVTMKHGYDSCPDSLLPVIADQARSFRTGGRVTSESLASRSLRIQVDDPLAGPILQKYRLGARP